jgi:hypothetical protein
MSSVSKWNRQFICHRHVRSTGITNVDRGTTLVSAIWRSTNIKTASELCQRWKNFCLRGTLWLDYSTASSNISLIILMGRSSTHHPYWVSPSDLERQSWRLLREMKFVPPPPHFSQVRLVVPGYLTKVAHYCLIHRNGSRNWRSPVLDALSKLWSLESDCKNSAFVSPHINVTTFFNYPENFEKELQKTWRSFVHFKIFTAINYFKSSTV